MVCHVVSASGARLLFSHERVPAGMGAGMVENQISQRDNTRITVSDGTSQGTRVVTIPGSQCQVED